MQVIDRIALILTIVGGLNWGSIGLFRFDLVAWICGGQTAVAARVICLNTKQSTELNIITLKVKHSV